MREFYKVSLNDNEFINIDPRLYINDLEERASFQVDTANRPGYGQKLVGQPERSKLDVTLRFMIKERDRAKRQTIVDQVNAWAAAPGWLHLSTRPEKRLYVVCTQSADPTAHKWNEELNLTLTAYDHPYWQERFPVKATYTGAYGTATLRPRGSRRCWLDADILNTSGGTINSLSVAANGCTLAFDGLGLGNGQTLRISHDPQGRLQAEVGSDRKLSCRTPASDDDVPLAPMQDNTVTLWADGACETTFYARGEWE